MNEASDEARDRNAQASSRRRYAPEHAHPEPLHDGLADAARRFGHQRDFSFDTTRHAAPFFRCETPKTGSRRPHFPPDRHRAQRDSLASAAATVSILPDEIVQHLTHHSLPRRVARASETPMICVSALYPNQPGSRFDGFYYVTTHAALARTLLQPLGLIEIRVSLGQYDLAGAAPPFWAISELHFTSRTAFDDAMRLCGEALFQDAKNYTDVNPVMQVSTLHPL
jgi:uncharacterized protein (TIGR02118 family)